jgi:hypothetical protein
MKRIYRNIAVGYAGFIVINTAVGYFTSNFRTGRKPGDNSLLDFNDWLGKFNPVWNYVIGTPGILISQPANPAIPTGATVTQSATGTTTTFNGSGLPVPLTPFG